MKIIKFNDVDLFEKYKMIYSSHDVTEAEPNTYYVSVPFSSGSVDLTNSISDSTTYSDVYLTLIMGVMKGSNDYNSVRTEFKNDYHGKHIDKIKINDDGLVYKGRIVGTHFSETASHLEIVINFRCQPYRLRNSKSVITYEPPATETTYSLPNESMPTNPTITTTHETEIKQGAKTWVVGAGTHKLAIMFRRGMNEIKLRSMVDYNLIPVANRQFEGWSVQGGATVTVTKCPLEVFEDGYQRNYLKKGVNLTLDGITYTWEEDTLVLNGTTTTNGQTIAFKNALKTVVDFKNGNIRVLTAFIENPTGTDTSNCPLFRYQYGSSLVDLLMNYNTVKHIIPIDREVTDIAIRFPAGLVFTNYRVKFKLEVESGINPTYTKAWEDYTDAEKPAAYIETSGGTAAIKYLYIPTLSSTEQHTVSVVVKNVGDNVLRVRNVAETILLDTQKNQMRNLSYKVEAPTVPTDINLNFASLTASGLVPLSFYAYNPEVYATSKRNRVTIEYQEGAL